MAITYVGFASNRTNYTSSISISVPAGTVNNDVMIAIVGGTRSSAPSGWTLIDSASSGTSSLGTVYCYYRVASSEPGSYTFNFTGSFLTVGCILTYRGVNTVSPVDLTNEDVSAVGSSTNFNTATITAPSNTWALSFAMGYEFGSSSTRTFSESSGTERFEDSISNTPSPDNTNLAVTDSNGTISAGSFSRSQTRSSAASAGVRGVILLKLTAVAGSASAAGATVDVDAFNATGQTGLKPAAGLATGVTATAFNPASVKAGNFVFPATATVQATGNTPLFTGRPSIAVAAYSPFAYFGTPALRLLKVEDEDRVKVIPNETRTVVIPDG